MAELTRELCSIGEGKYYLRSDETRKLDEKLYIKLEFSLRLVGKRVKIVASLSIFAYTYGASIFSGWNIHSFPF